MGNNKLFNRPMASIIVATRKRFSQSSGDFLVKLLAKRSLSQISAKLKGVTLRCHTVQEGPCKNKNNVSCCTVGTSFDFFYNHIQTSWNQKVYAKSFRSTQVIIKHDQGFHSKSPVRLLMKLRCIHKLPHRISTSYGFHFHEHIYIMSGTRDNPLPKLPWPR